MSQGKSAAHTPGPWKALHDADGDYAIVDESRVLAVTDSDTPEDAANARLIAAGPDLLDALNRMLISFSGDLCIECGEVSGAGKTCDSCYVIGKAIEAIEKAEGESQ